MLFVFVDYPEIDEDDEDYTFTPPKQLNKQTTRYGTTREDIISILFHRKFNYKAMMEVIFQSNKTSLFPCVYFDNQKYMDISP